ncbi:hypothetical protein AB6A40_006494 [Gnathostoma spinigerum]|uniref:RING-type domain-containing protein n=1 Tax=Gnathostoma spinigerum TaxID=75299 RepID=A0ABD6EU55_9BILA
MSSVIATDSEEVLSLVDLLSEYLSHRKTSCRTCKRILLSLLSSFEHRTLLLTNTLACMRGENETKLKAFVKSSIGRTADMVMSNICAVCHGPPCKTFFLMNCGHLIHTTCSASTYPSCPCRDSSWDDRVYDGLHAFDTTSMPSSLTKSAPNIFDESHLKLTLGSPRKLLPEV